MSDDVERMNHALARLEGGKIKAIADAGEVMPQKTTYFYPKLASGLVVHLVERDVDLI